MTIFSIPPPSPVCAARLHGTALRCRLRPWRSSPPAAANPADYFTGLRRGRLRPPRGADRRHADQAACDAGDAGRPSAPAFVLEQRERARRPRRGAVRGSRSAKAQLDRSQERQAPRRTGRRPGAAGAGPGGADAVDGRPARARNRSSPTSSSRLPRSTPRAPRRTRPRPCRRIAARSCEVAQLAARSDEIAAAAHEMKAAQAQLAQAQWRVDQKAQSPPPVAARVDRSAVPRGRVGPAGSPSLAAAAGEHQGALLRARSACSAARARPARVTCAATAAARRSRRRSASSRARPNSPRP